MAKGRRIKNTTVCHLDFPASMPMIMMMMMMMMTMMMMMIIIIIIIIHDDDDDDDDDESLQMKLTGFFWRITTLYPQFLLKWRHGKEDGAFGIWFSTQAVWVRKKQWDVGHLHQRGWNHWNGVIAKIFASSHFWHVLCQAFYHPDHHHSIIPDYSGFFNSERWVCHSCFGASASLLI